MLNKAEIASLIPHAGRMCLLERLVRWSEDEVHCLAISHRDADNPLRRGGQLSAVHLIEYCAQTAAVHGALAAKNRDFGEGLGHEAGLLAAVRGLALNVARLDDLSSPLELQVRRLAANPQGRIYSFEARADGRALGSGSLVIMVGGTA